MDRRLQTRIMGGFSERLGRVCLERSPSGAQEKGAPARETDRPGEGELTADLETAVISPINGAVMERYKLLGMGEKEWPCRGTMLSLVELLDIV